MTQRRRVGGDGRVPARLTVTNTTWLAAAARPSTTPNGAIDAAAPAASPPSEHQHHARERQGQRHDAGIVSRSRPSATSTTTTPAGYV